MLGSFPKGTVRVSISLLFCYFAENIMKDVKENNFN
nr:MAG TPA: hypothetical protein [Caudoviricetes sp.]